MTKIKYSVYLWAFFLLLLIQPTLSQDLDKPLEVISVDNAHQLQEFDQLGYGWLHKALWHPDHQRLFVAGSNALVVYSVDNWIEPTVIHVSNPPLVNITISDDGSRTALAQHGIISVIDNQTYQQQYQVEAQTYRSSLFESYIQFTESYLTTLLVDQEYDYALRVWDIETGELIDTILRADEPDSFPSEPPDSLLNDDGVRQVLQTRSHQLLPKFYVKDSIEVDGVQRWPAQTIISPDGQFVLYRLCPDDQPDPWNCTISQILVRERDTGRTVRDLTIETYWVGFIGADIDHIGSIVCTAENTYAYNPCQKWQLSKVNTQEGTLTNLFSGYFINPPHTIEFTRDGRYIAVADSAQILVWDASTYERTSQLTGFHGPPLNIEFSGDGQRLVASSSSMGGGRAINIWQRTADGFIAQKGIPCGGTIALHPSDEVLICGGASDSFWGIVVPMELWQMDDEPSLIREYADDMVLNVSFSPDGNWLTVGQYAQIEIRNFITNETIITVDSHVPYSSIDFSRDMRHLFLYINGVHPYLYLWSDVMSVNTLTVSELSRFNLANDPMRSHWFTSVFSGNARWLAVGGPGRSIRLYDVNSNDLLHVIEIDGAAVELQFSPDDRLLAAAVCQSVHAEGRERCALYLLDVHEGAILYTSPTFGEAIYDLAFNPTGTILATAYGRVQVHFNAGLSQTNAIRLWGIPSED